MLGVGSLQLGLDPSVVLDAADGSAPFNSVAPSIVGIPVSGELVTATPGVWLYATSVTGQWMRGVTPIAGQTGLTYRRVLADEDQDIWYREAGNGDVGGTVYAESNKSKTIAGVYGGWNTAETAYLGSLLDGSGVGAVEQLTDPTGNARHWTQANTANRGVTGSRTFANGLRAMDCIPPAIVTYGFTDSAFRGMINSSAHTFICAFASDIPATNRGIIRAVVGGSGRYGASYGANLATYGLGPGTSAQVAVTTDANAHVIVGSRNGTNQKVHCDGLSAENENATTPGLSGGPYMPHNSTAWDGLLGKGWFFNRELTLAEKDAIAYELAQVVGAPWAHMV